MANEIFKFELNVAARDEYELEHYGFTVDQFKMESECIVLIYFTKYLSVIVFFCFRCCFY